MLAGAVGFKAEGVLPKAHPHAGDARDGRRRDRAGADRAASQERWRALTVVPEHRCAPYDRGDYPYRQSVEARIVESMGGRVYGPYTGRRFVSRRETDIEHMVATSEAHDSGLCATDAGTKRRFASDLLNLTLAAPSVNRHEKSGKDAGG